MTKKSILFLSIIAAIAVGTATLLFTNLKTQARDVSDGIPPVLSSRLPASDLPAGTTSATLGVTTDEGATCRYSTTPGVDIDSMVDEMLSEDMIVHTAELTGLSGGNTYTYYIRCGDGFWNVTTDDFIVSFSVEAAAGATTYTITGPTSGVAGHESSAFSITPDNSYTGTITVGYSGAGLDGSTDLTFNDSSTPQTFTITPTEKGTVTLTATNSGSLSNPGSVIYQVAGRTISGSVAYSSISSGNTNNIIIPTQPPVSEQKQPARGDMFTKNLSLGMVDPEVLLLQQFLNKHGYTVSSSGPGSTGNETTKFGRATKIALTKFQLANHLSPAIGYFGPLTRSAANNLK